MSCVDGLAHVTGFVYCYEGFPELLIKKLLLRPSWNAVVSSLSTLAISVTLYTMSTLSAFVCFEWNNGALELCVEGWVWAIKPTEDLLDLVLVFLIVAPGGFHALYWCSVVDSEQVLV